MVGEPLAPIAEGEIRDQLAGSDVRESVEWRQKSDSYTLCAGYPSSRLWRLDDPLNIIYFFK